MAVVLGVTSLTGYSVLNLAMFVTGTDGARYRGILDTAAANATVTSVDVYWDGSYDGDCSIKGLILNSSGTVLGTSNAVAGTGGVAQWLTCTLITPVSITAATSYHIGCFEDGASQNGTNRFAFFNHASSGPLGYQDNSGASGSYTSLPSSVGSLATDGNRLALRASGTVGSSIAPLAAQYANQVISP
jgi:hypothetical protein